MSEVPKFVRQKLARQPTGEHPDANLLAAFAEDALTQRERAQVLAHLSACGACRQAVSLALPDVPTAAPAAAAGGTRWARWPMLRWAGVAAAVVVVAAAVVVQNARRTGPVARVASQESVARPAEPGRADSTLPDAKGPSVAQDRAEDKERHAGRLSGRAKAEIRADQKKDATSGVTAKAAPAPANRVVQSNQPVQSQAGSLGLDAAPAPQASVPAQAAAPVMGGVTTQQSMQQARTPAIQAGSARESAEVMVQADAVAAQKVKTEGQEQIALKGRAGARTAAASASAEAGRPMMKTALSAPMHWRVSAEGALERSLDAGRTWQFVRVGAATPAFRTLAAVGRDLWAGGAGGALYHSPDNGRTWTRIVATAGDATLESDIARVEFSDAQHGTVTTTAGETWTTADGGATWSVHQ
ncbi:MAG: zf-HC2 domain-containing protein [Acidobacteriia bacterium]|nr:zf-HC2 domain-containing protein [Terriglobia bacterium]